MQQEVLLTGRNNLGKSFALDHIIMRASGDSDCYPATQQSSSSPAGYEALTWLNRACRSGGSNRSGGGGGSYRHDGAAPAADVTLVPPPAGTFDQHGQLSDCTLLDADDSYVSQMKEFWRDAQRTWLEAEPALLPLRRVDAPGTTTRFNNYLHKGCGSLHTLVQTLTAGQLYEFIVYW